MPKKLVHCFASIANAPPFSGLRRFPKGRGFKQWTGNDSKVLMKVSSKLTLWFPQLLMHLGIPISDSRPCTIATDLHLSCVLGILLYCLEKCHHGN